MRVADSSTSKSQNTSPDRKGHDWSGGDTARAAVLCPQLKTAGKPPTHRAPGHSAADEPVAPEARLSEAEGLAEAIGLNVCLSGLVPVSRPRPATLFGPGKVEELRGLIRAEEVEIVIVDHALTPVQQRNLERAWDVKVLDRTGLILEIFGKRARTREGRLQVELAHLSYQKSRLVRTWTHLERQRGGYGFLGGPGERQIEADRRMIQKRIDAIVRELETVKRTRKLHREGRARVPYPVVALVGYTNAGKSTLFNRLTDAGVLADDMLFATLDPTMREIELPEGTRVILSDTVGFISNLPTALIAAFRATLEEVIEADVILLVRDIADDSSDARLADVQHVLRELGIDPAGETTALIEAWNKIDLVPESQAETLRAQAERQEGRAVCISAATGEGLETLLTMVEQRLTATYERMRITLPPEAGALAHWLHENTQIITRDVAPNGQTTYDFRISAGKRSTLRRRLKQNGVVPEPRSAA